ncbi:type II secretion system protein J (GspJ) [Shimia isoporae]|uniref:Type II secretion system protein J n=1 Tax=Shimia isoporae TaxID=647720 RepID=A0A4R1N8I9_9RHOB|nr:type II secretion system protein GspJ [Shimia isoporae]TCK99860.1 type II secretion system protein J (GspJ) [Shimia isoporae]
MKVQSDAGLSLLELVVAMALFALVAVMGLQLMTGTLRMRDRLETSSTETAELSRSLALLRADIANAAPLLFNPPGDSRPLSALLSTPGGFEISVSGQSDLPPVDALGFHRIEWRVTSEGTLTRQHWPVLAPANATAKSPEQTVLSGVSSLSLRTYWPVRGWVDGTNDPNPAPATTAPAQDSDRGPLAANGYTDQLPVAVEITLRTRDFGNLRLVEVLQ